MNSCKAEIDFFGNVNTVHPDNVLTVDHFQRYLCGDGDAATSKSAWVVHFSKVLTMTNFKNYLIKEQGKIIYQVQHYAPVQEHPIFLSTASLLFKYITSDFDSTLTWNKYNDLPKTTKSTLTSWERGSGSMWEVEVYIPVSTFDEITPSSENAYGMAWEINQTASGYEGTLTDVTIHHPEIYGGNPLLISRNYLLTNKTISLET